MKTFKFTIDTLYPKDPGVQIGDRVLLQAPAGQDLADFIVVSDTESSGSCFERCAMLNGDWCIRYKDRDDKHPCILCGCDGLFVRTPDLEEL